MRQVVNSFPATGPSPWPAPAPRTAPRVRPVRRFPGAAKASRAHFDRAAARTLRTLRRNNRVASKPRSRRALRRAAIAAVIASLRPAWRR